MSDAIGILGGTFDPIHYGHLRTGLEVAQQLNLQHIRLIPSARPPHREQPQASVEQRLSMLHLAVKNNPYFIVDDRELEREGTSYTVDTLLSLRQDFPDNPLYFILGEDAFLGIQSWHRWQQLLSLTHIVVMNRPGETSMPTGLSDWYQQYLAVETDREKPIGNIWPVEVTSLAISSTGIRHTLSQNLSPQFLMPDTVIQLIQQAGLYQTEH